MPPAKKTAAKKAGAKPVSTTSEEPEVQTEDDQEAGTSSVEDIAREVIEGKWNSGRERDILLTGAGHDPRAVQSEVARQLSQK